MVAKYSPDKFWVAAVKFIVTAQSREAAISAIEAKFAPSTADVKEGYDAHLFADWGFIADDSEDGRAYPREVRFNGHPEDYFSLPDGKKEPLFDSL